MFNPTFPMSPCLFSSLASNSLSSKSCLFLHMFFFVIIIISSSINFILHWFRKFMFIPYLACKSLFILILSQQQYIEEIVSFLLRQFPLRFRLGMFRLPVANDPFRFRVRHLVEWFKVLINIPLLSIIFILNLYALNEYKISV